MNRTFFISLLVSLLPYSGQSIAKPVPDTSETNTLYRSCKNLLHDATRPEADYCAQLISALYPTIYATRGIIARKAEESETSCEKRKFDIIEDIQQIPPTNDILKNFSYTEIARNFITFIDSNSKISEFPFLESLADRAMAQSIIDWKKHTPQSNLTTVETELSQDMKDSLEIGKNWGSLDLIRSCEKFLTTEKGDRLCNATISGALIIYSLGKNHKLPHYKESDACHEEKNALLHEFVQKRSACFPNGKNLKKKIAADIVRTGSLEMEMKPRTERSSAAYWMASKLSFLYRCRGD